MRPIHILLVDDNEGDILLTRETFEDAKINVVFSVAKDGRDAIDLLTRSGKYMDCELPDIILLDVNLPRKNGHEVLHYIKENILLKHIPVIMLTTSSSQRDIRSAYEGYVNCFITKPIEVNDYLKVVAAIENFWLSIVQLPQK